MSEELNELRKISKILTLVNASALENELSKYATTNERKRVWVLINGERMPDDLIETSGMKRRTIYDFLKVLSNADLIENLYGKAPKKKLEFTPAKWVNLLESNEKEKEQEAVK